MTAILQLQGQEHGQLDHSPGAKAYRLIHQDYNPSHLRTRKPQPGEVIHLHETLDIDWTDIATVDIVLWDEPRATVVFAALANTGMGTRVRYQAPSILIDVDVRV